MYECIEEEGLTRVVLNVFWTKKLKLAVDQAKKFLICFS